MRAQADARHSLRFPRDARRLLVGDLEYAVKGRGVELGIGGQHLVGVVVSRSVHGRAAGVDEAAELQPPRQLEHRQGALHVDARAGDRVGGAEGELQRGEVDEVGDATPSRGLLERVDVVDVRAEDLEAVDLCTDQDQAQPIEPAVGAHDGHGRALAHEVTNYPGPDAAGATGDQEVLIGHGQATLE